MGTTAPPGGSDASKAAPTKSESAAAFLCLERLKKRGDFLKAARGRRKAAKGFVLQAVRRGDDGPPRVGFTCSRKVGNAVARNRARRRLREAARIVLGRHARPGWDYVLIGRRETTATIPFERLCADLRRALHEIHDGAT